MLMGVLLLLWLVLLLLVLDNVERRVVSREVLAGTEIPRGGRRGSLHLTLHCHHQNDSCNKTGNLESCFNVLSVVRNRGTILDSISTNHSY